MDSREFLSRLRCFVKIPPKNFREAASRAEEATKNFLEVIDSTMKISIKGIILSSVVTFGAACVVLLPAFWMFPRAMRNIHALPLLPSLLLLAFGACLNVLAGYLLARFSRPGEFSASVVVLAGVFALGSLRAGALWFVINAVVSCVLMLIGRALTR